MEPSLESLLAESKNQNIWLAISQNQIVDAQKAISSKLVNEGKSLFNFLKKGTTNPDNTILQIVSQTLSGKERKPLSSLKLTLAKEAADRFAEIIRFLTVLHYNGSYKQQAKHLSDEVLDLLEDLSEQVSVEAGDYPNSTIAGYVWGGGADIRKYCDPLAALFRQENDLRGVAITLQNKSKITASIMNHYPQTLGPDMIAAAKAMEVIGETDIAKLYYNAIITDFPRVVVAGIKKYPEEGVFEHEIISLSVLKQAYENLNRLNGTNLYTEELQFIIPIIDRGATYVSTDEESDE